jgi:hypothetical protein
MLLSNGTVLVAGGLNSSGSGGAVTSAETYDPAAGTWTSTGSLGTARADHTATLFTNGKLMVTGGYPYGGSMTTISSAEIYDPVAGTWSYTGAMSTSRRLHTATLLPNGTVLAAGGIVNSMANITDLASAELYDPATGIWTVTGSMTTTRMEHTATLLPNGTTLVTGGGGGGQASSELYYP